MIVSILIAVGLNFDTFSVAVVEGSQSIKPSIRDSLKVGLFFGIGQAFMTLLGTFLGLGFKLLIINIDHWIAFLLLSFIGGKLISESKKEGFFPKKKNIINIKSLFLLAIATSIDALVVGITLAFINSSVIATIIIIGIVSFIVSFIGYYVGEKFKKFNKKNIKIIGGLILIAIGVKILIQHLFFGG